MDTSTLIITISVVLAAIAFVVLVIFASISLVRLSKLLKNSDDKLHVFDPLFGKVSKVGRVVEQKVEEDMEEKEARHAELTLSALEFVEWGLLGLGLFMKLRRKK